MAQQDAKSLAETPPEEKPWTMEEALEGAKKRRELHREQVTAHNGYIQALEECIAHDAK